MPCVAVRVPLRTNLLDFLVDEAEERAGLFHHHFPCLASMKKLPDFNYDTLMHASAHLLQDNIGEQIKPFKRDSLHYTQGRGVKNSF